MININRALIALALGLVLAACNTTPKTKEVPVEVEKVVAYQCGTPPANDPFKALPVKWSVQQLSSGSKVFALTAQYFENLMTNLVNSKASGKQVRAQRDFYAECVKRSQEPAPAVPPPKPTGSKPDPPAKSK